MEECQKVRQNLINYGYNLPNFNQDGFIYIPNKDFSIWKKISIEGIMTNRSIKNAIEFLLSYIPGVEEPLKNVLNEVIIYEKI